MIKLKRDDFECRHQDDGPPLLVLGVTCPEYKGEFYANKFKSPDFLNIAHQTAGLGCHQHYFQGVILPPTADGLRLMNELDHKWEDSQVGALGKTLDTILEYREYLRRVGLDCNRCHSYFEEAFYPVDLTDEALKILVSPERLNSLPKNLDDLIEFDSGMDKLCGSVGRWGLYILGQNSD